MKSQGGNRVQTMNFLNGLFPGNTNNEFSEVCVGNPFSAGKNFPLPARKHFISWAIFCHSQLCFDLSFAVPGLSFGNGSSLIEAEPKPPKTQEFLFSIRHSLFFPAEILKE